MDLPRSTRALVEVALRFRASSPTTTSPAQECLDIGSAQGAVAQALGCGYLHDHWGACVTAQAAGITPVYHADQLPPGSYQLICLEAKELDPALVRAFVAEAAHQLHPGGALITTAEPAELTPWFGEVNQQGEVLVARHPQGQGIIREPLTYSLAMGEHQLVVHSEPGVFSPRGLDPGTRELLAIIEAKPGAEFLDLGCGAGVVSLVASELWHCQVTAVDVSARALRLTQQNAPAATVLPSDGFAALGERRFEIIASNPPYHTDFAVAKRFIEGAYQHLKPGGWLHMVVKRGEWYERKIRSLFGGCRKLEREGYVLLSAQRRLEEQRPAPTPPERTTKKHAKRIAASSRRKPTHRGGPGPKP